MVLIGSCTLNYLGVLRHSRLQRGEIIEGGGGGRAGKVGSGDKVTRV